MSDEIRFAWWNLQNYFDTDDDPISNDFDYTPAKGWTPQRFIEKRNRLVDALVSLADPGGIDLLGVCEIEKDGMLQDLCDGANLGLTVATDPSGTTDLRGIDTAIAFNPQKLALEEVASHVVTLRYATRDILEIRFRHLQTDEPLIVFATHWPSRRLGRYDSEPQRISVAEQIAYRVQHNLKLDAKSYEAARAADDFTSVLSRWNTPVLILGDFNDEPGDRSVVEHLRASNDESYVTGTPNGMASFYKETSQYRARDVFLFNAVAQYYGIPLLCTYFFSGGRDGPKPTNRYNILDQVVVSRGLLGHGRLRLDTDSVRIVRSPSFATPSGRPRPYQFPRPKAVGDPPPAGNAQGLSDHLPVIGTIRA